METGPNSLIVPEDEKITAFKLSRWPLYAVIVAAALMIGVLVWSISFSGKGGSDEAEQKDLDLSENGPPLVVAENRELASGLPVGVARPETLAPPVPKEPLIVVRDTSSQIGQLRQQELENLRRRKAQAQMDGLTAPLGLKRSQTASQGAPAEGAAVARTGSGQLPAMPGVESDPSLAAQKDKEGFLARSSRDDSWILPHTRTAGQQYELKTERVIPAAMITGINSDLPGQIQAQVTQDVYDSATGDYLLIPKGAKLTGNYDSRVIFGQERILVAWTRIVYPDGSALSLGAMPGADVSGYAGFNDKVDNHYFKIFGNALLMSLITGGMSYAVDSLDSSSGDSNTPTMQQEMGTALASQLGQTSLTLLQKNINIAPTLEVRPGYEFVIVVTKGIVFDRPYRPYRQGG